MPLFSRRRANDHSPESRAPKAATSVSSTGVGLTSLEGLDDEQIMRRVWLANVYVDACIRAIAEDLSTLKFRAGPNPDRPEDYNLRAPLAMLLGPPPGGPNPHTSPRRLWQWTVAQRIALGRWGWEVELDGARRPANLWPLVTRRLEPIPPDAKSRDRSRWFAAYDYTPEGAGAPVRLRPDQVVYDWVPHPDNFRRWISPLQAARLDVDVLVSQDRYDSAFIRNDSKPSTIVVHQEFADVSERDKWRDDFDARHKGPGNAGRTHFVEQPLGSTIGVKDALEVITVGVSQRESQALERYAAKLRAVCVALGVPMGRLGDVSGRTYANADREIRTYWQTTIMNLATELAEAVNMQLAPRVGGGSDVAWWDTSEVEELRPTPLLALPSLTEAVRSELISKAEGRELIGYDPDDVPEQDEPPAQEPAAPTPAEAQETPDDETERAPQRAQAPASPPAGDGGNPGGTSLAAGAHRTTDAEREERQRREQRDAWATAVDAHVGSLEQLWQDRVQALFDRQRRAVIDRLRGNRGVSAHRRGELRAEPLFDRDWWTRHTIEETLALYSSVVTLAGGAVAARFGLSFDLHAPHVESFIRTRANQLAGPVTDTTYRGIQDALVAGVQAGESIDKLAARIEDLFDVTWAGRAEMVARTEVISAYNGGTVTTALGYGPSVVGAMEWLATGDNRTRPAHRSASGQVVPLGQAFLVGGERLAYPGDPGGSPSNTVRCRCTVLPVPPDQVPTWQGLTRTAGQVELREVERLVVAVALGERDWTDALAELEAVQA